MRNSQLPLIAIVAGPTASGKSSLALDLARALDGTIINADSMQIYRDLPVLTAQPGPEALGAVPHRLYGALDGAELCSAARWADLARAEIAAASAEGRLPILVGGTGLYLRTLLNGIADIPPIPEPVRMAARARHAEIGGPAFHAELAALDPESAARLHPGDSQRMVRAFEVVKATGRTLGDWQRAAAETVPAYDARQFILLPPRDLVYAACDDRLWQMVEQGALDEVQALMVRNLAPDLPVMKAVGVPELAAHLAGAMNLADAVVAAQQSTRRYAKRQFTWFRHQMPTAHVIESQFSHSFLASICQKIRNSP